MAGRAVVGSPPGQVRDLEPSRAGVGGVEREDARPTLFNVVRFQAKKKGRAVASRAACRCLFLAAILPGSILDDLIGSARFATPGEHGNAKHI